MYLVYMLSLGHILISDLVVAISLYNIITSMTVLVYLLANGLYKIISESIKLILDVEQFRVSSDLIVLPQMHRKCHLFLSSFLPRILIKIFHGFHRNSIEFFQPRIHHEV